MVGLVTAHIHGRIKPGIRAVCLCHVMRMWILQNPVKELFFSQTVMKNYYVLDANYFVIKVFLKSFA